jgi:anti-anti-sigma regulatory factor
MAPMAENLSVTIEQRRSGARLIKLAGSLDEHNRLRDLGAKIDPGAALINLSGVEHISERGVAAWSEWLALLEAKGIRPALIACSPAVVAQLNQDESFARGAVVKSFFVPYRCGQCEQDKLQLVHVVDLDAEPHDVPPCSCDGCGVAMTCAEDPAEYVAFVRRLNAAAAAAAAEAARLLARGSSSSVTAEHIKRVSKPRLREPSRNSMSAYQLAEPARRSEHDLSVVQRTLTTDLRLILVFVAVLFICVVVLVAML